MASRQGNRESLEGTKELVGAGLLFEVGEPLGLCGSPFYVMGTFIFMLKWGP